MSIIHNKHMHTQTDRHTHTHIHTPTHANKHTHQPTQTSTHTITHTDTHTHTHTRTDVGCRNNKAKNGNVADGIFSSVRMHYHNYRGAPVSHHHLYSYSTHTRTHTHTHTSDLHSFVLPRSLTSSYKRVGCNHTRLLKKRLYWS